MAGRTVHNSDAPQMVTPQVYFKPEEFNIAIWEHAYDIICEKAIRCPCQGASGSPIPTCQNCHGSGYFYVNPVMTKAIVQGLNRITQYVHWAPELMGTAAITVRDQDKLLISYLDRITLNDEYAAFSEMIVSREMTPEHVSVFLSYAPIEIFNVWLYSAYNEPLVQVDPSSYVVNADNPYCINFEVGSVPAGVGVSVFYKHRVQYHVIDMPHEIRASEQRNKVSGQLELIKLPLQVVGRRSHLVDMQRPNYDGSGVIYNDYAPDSY